MNLIGRLGPSTKSGILVVAAFLVFWAGLSGISGALFSGFHIADDHEIVGIHNDFVNHVSVGSVLKREIKSDFEIRFRPLYYLDRILSIRVLGDNFFVWSLYRVLLAGLTSFLLFCAARRLGFGVLEALLFPLLSMTGIQTNVWFWRGPAEAGGMLMFAAAFYCICKRERTRGGFNDALCAVFCVAMSLYKENFALAIPGLCLLKVGLDRYVDGISWRKSVGRNWPLFSGLLLFLAADLAIIKFLVGTNQIGYAGVQVNPARYAMVTLQFFAYNGQGLLLALLGTVWALHLKGKKGPFVFFTAVFALFLASQAVVYAMSGVIIGQGRYLLPASVGFSLALCAMLNGFKKETPCLPRAVHTILKIAIAGGAVFVTGLCVAFILVPSLSDSLLLVIAGVKGRAIGEHWQHKLIGFAARFAMTGSFAVVAVIVTERSQKFRTLAMALISVMLFYCLMSGFLAGRDFAREGKSVSLCLDKVKSATSTASLIVLVADPGFNVEDVTSMTKYLTIKMDRKNIRYWFFDSPMSKETYLNDWKKSTLALYGDKRIGALSGLKAASCLLILREMEKPFLESGGSEIAADFTGQKYGVLACYVRR
jgi:hypothetical protein